MCGIAGLTASGQDTRPTLSRMLDRLAHRGPDDTGVWLNQDLALGHRRLSIIDLSPMGRQPMISSGNGLVLTYNGEIYNYQEMKRELDRSGKAPIWRGHSDTEVLLACIESWGLQNTLERCNGMFALAVWDVRQKQLTLARDRMGEKPLYFGWIDGRLAFASELKALTEIGGWSPKMHSDAVASFLSYGYVRGPQSAVEGVFRLPPGSLLTLHMEELRRPMAWENLLPRITQYWSVEKAAIAGQANLLPDENTSLEELGALLDQAVSMRMVADVPVGSFLSGGIDSSLVTAVMQSRSSRPVHTFSIGFHDEQHNEAHYAKAVAAHLGTEHTELYLGPDVALALVPRLAETFDEPFADNSQLPTMLVSQLARKQVTVALSGDGGDELFAGYARYFGLLNLWNAIGKLPTGVRRSIGPSTLMAAHFAQMVTPRTSDLSFKLQRLAERLRATDIDALRLAFIGGAGSSRIQRSVAPPVLAHCLPPLSIKSPLRRLLYGDQTDYLPDDILLKVDRASMAYSLETRVPFLDHRLVELSWRLPDAQLTHGNQGKLPLRRLLDRHVPAALINRPKQGFAPPMAAWLRSPLKEWANSLLSIESLQSLPMIDARKVRHLWSAHLRCQVDASQALWNVLMLSDWRKRFGASF